jgi:hypothetical protein
MPNWKKVIVSGSNAALNSLKVNTSFTASGLIYPAQDNGEFSFIQTDGNGNLSLQYVETLYENIINGEATTLIKGTPVYVSGSQGADQIVYRADASNPSKMPATYIAGDNIATGQLGRGILLGLITGVDTTGYSAGTEVFVGIGGGWTSTRPTGSSIIQSLGIVTKEGTGGQGVVLNSGPSNLPNLSPGNIWMGNGNSYPIPTTTASFYTGSFTGSFKGDGSGLTGITATITGSTSYSEPFSNQTVVVVTHSLDVQYPFVQIYDENGEIFIPLTIKSIDSDTIRVNFSTASSGYITIAKGGHLISGSFSSSSAFPYTGSASILGSLSVNEGPGNSTFIEISNVSRSLSLNVDNTIASLKLNDNEIIRFEPTKTIIDTDVEVIGSSISGSSFIGDNFIGDLTGTASLALDLVDPNYGSYYPGIISGSEGWSQSNNGTITLPAVQVALYDNAFFRGKLKLYNVAGGISGTGGIPALVNNTTNYVYIDYNSGTPIWNINTTGNINNSSQVEFMIVYRLDNFIHVLEFGNDGAGLPNKLNNRFSIFI